MKLLLPAIAFCVSAFAQAQSYPNKPIRLVVPFAPGGSSTIVARSVAAEMEKGLGQPIVIENKGGGGGNLAMHDVARSDPDGYTIIIGHVGSLAMTPYITPNLGYDVNRDFAPISPSPRCRTFRRACRCAGEQFARVRGAREAEAGRALLRLGAAAPGTWRWSTCS